MLWLLLVIPAVLRPKSEDSQFGVSLDMMRSCVKQKKLPSLIIHASVSHINKSYNIKQITMLDHRMGLIIPLMR